MSDFDDVGNFHRKFGLDAVPINGPACPKLPSPEAMEFRVKFLLEEVQELTDAYNERDLAGVADALVDLVYVALGTAQMAGLPWAELWASVQATNMAKERCGIDHKFERCRSEGQPCVFEDPSGCHKFLDGSGMYCHRPEAEHSKRGSVLDVIKPPGWTPPDIEGVLRAHGWEDK